MPLTIDYNSFINPTVDWFGDAIDPPIQPYLYQPITENITDLSLDDRTIIFSNLPAGFTVVNAPATTAPYDSVFIDTDYTADYIFLKSGIGMWTGELFTAAYTSGGYWAIGVPYYSSPGVILTGSGDYDTDIKNITWVSISEADNGNTPPEPFALGIFQSGFSWSGTLINEIMTSYDVISPSGIQIRSTGVEGSGFNDIPRVLRNLHVLFSQT